MQRQGTVKKIDGPTVWISLAPLGCCGGQAGGNCHCASSSTQVEFKAKNASNETLEIGDFVTIENSTSASWAGVVRLVVVPGILLALGWVVWGAWGAAGGAALGIAASLLFPQSKESGYPQITAKVPVADLTPLAWNSHS